jgi:hypothetical protein
MNYETDRRNEALRIIVIKQDIRSEDSF